VLEKGEVRTGCLVGKPKVKRPLGLPRHRWNGGFELNLEEI
jgi:hypothetical protein